MSWRWYKFRSKDGWQEQFVKTKKGVYTHLVSGTIPTKASSKEDQVVWMKNWIDNSEDSNVHVDGAWEIE